MRRGETRRTGRDETGRDGTGGRPKTDMRLDIEPAKPTHNDADTDFKVNRSAPSGICTTCDCRPLRQTNLIPHTSYIEQVRLSGYVVTLLGKSR